MAKGKVIKSSSGSFVKGGSGHMFGKQSVGPRKSLSQAGTGKAQTGSGGKWAKGGNTHMFGKQSANARKSGQTGK